MNIIKYLKRMFWRVYLSNRYYDNSDIKTLKILVDNLVKVLKDGPTYTRLGLCHIVDLPWEITKVFGTNWEHYSGDLVYPIGGYVDYTTHRLRGTLWVGEQRALRLDYCLHLVKEINKFVERVE